MADPEGEDFRKATCYLAFGPLAALHCRFLIRYF